MLKYNIKIQQNFDFFFFALKLQVYIPSNWSQEYTHQNEANFQLIFFSKFSIQILNPDSRKWVSVVSL
jgi:hypothetical protein